MLYKTRPQITTPGQGVDTLLQAEREVEALELQVSDAKAYQYELETSILPDVFGAAEQKEATSNAGAKAIFKNHILGSLPKIDEKSSETEQAIQRAAREAAINKAEEYGWGPLIKTTMTASWDKGDRDKALETARNLRASDNSVVMKVDESIHAQTLAARARERLRQGLGIELSVLGLTCLPAVKLTKRPKQ